MPAKVDRSHHAFAVLGACLVVVTLLSIEPMRATAQQERCGVDTVAVQILGSGGPFAATNRASTSYLVWRAGRAVVMVDIGGGAFLRFSETGAQLEDLSLLAISHLHPDHVSDLPALLWLSERARQKPLKLTGPSGGGPFPDIATFLKRMFDPANGAFPVLAGTLGEKGNGVRLDVSVLDVNAPHPATVLKDEDLEVTAIGVPHTNAPTLAYRVQVGQFSIVFSGDQTGRDPKFVNFTMDADVLVMHFALSTMASEALARVHATPTVVGQVARDAKVRRLVLSHFIQGYPQDPRREDYSLFNLDQNVGEVKKYYSGPVVQAADLQCLPVR
jgi:ribonuclease BN (tRNA processing enzyme)